MILQITWPHGAAKWQTEAHGKAHRYSYSIDGGSRQGSSIQLLYRRTLTARLVDTVTLSTEAHVSPAIDFKVLSEPQVSLRMNRTVPSKCPARGTPVKPVKFG